MADPITTPTTPATPAAPVAVETPSAPVAPSVDLAALQATVAKYEKDIAKLKDENAQRRQDTKQEREAREAAARTAGDLGTVVKSLEEKLAEAHGGLKELDSLKADALAHREWRERKAKTLDVEAAKLAPAMKEIYDALPSVEAKAKFVKAMAVAPIVEPAKQPATPAPLGGTPAPVVQPFDLNTASLAELQAFEKSNPTEYAALSARSNQPTPKTIRGFLGF